MCEQRYFKSLSQQANAIYALKHLIRKGIIPDEFRQQQINELKVEREHQQSVFNVLITNNLDTNDEILYTSIKLGAFALNRMFVEDAATLCNQSYTVVMNCQLDLTKNRMILGLNNQFYCFERKKNGV